VTFKNFFIKGPVYNLRLNSQRDTNIILGKCRVLQIMEFVVQRTWKEFGSYLKQAVILPFIIL